MDLVAAQAALRAALAREGHVLLEGPQMRALLEAAGPLHDWPQFAGSWERLEVDSYLADHGRYRRRRHAHFAVPAQGAIRRLPHGPHYQSREYNALFGGIERWFEPMEAAVGAGASLSSILALCRALFGGLEPAVTRWQVEVHQFRIEASSGQAGQPTPEGIHRDGVDYVLVLMIRRCNVLSGTTSIHAPDGRPLGSFTLTHPCDAVLIDDRRVHHGVTAVTPLDVDAPAFRDVLVVTFRRE